MRHGIEQDEPTRGEKDGADLDRRSFLQLVGTGAAMAACGRALPEKVLAYNEVPPELTPGVPLRFATSMVVDAHAVGVIVTSREGRPIKVEGNPAHPASLGAVGAFEQASVLELYDSRRARALLRAREPSSWQRFVADVVQPARSRPDKVRFILAPTSSPTHASLIERVRSALPGARLSFDSPTEGCGARGAAQAAFGRELAFHIDAGAANTILALDADFLDQGPMRLRYSRQFADARRIEGPASSMNRLYVVEPRPSPTGSLADHRLRKRSLDIPPLAASVVTELLRLARRVPGLPDTLLDLAERAAGHRDRDWARTVAADLWGSRPRSLLIAGERQPVETHLWALVGNLVLGSGAVWTTERTLVDAGDATQSLEELADDVRAGRAETVVALGGNPSYTSSPELELPGALKGATTSVYLGLYGNETARDCGWFIPELVGLESWGDARAYDGTVSFVQPLMVPLVRGRTVAQLLAAFAGEIAVSDRDLFVEHWRQAGAEARLEEGLRLGLWADTALAHVQAPLNGPGIVAALERDLSARRDQPGSLELDLYVDPRVHDGRFAANPWLQELPDPVTKLTWDNAALVSPRTAGDLGIADEDMVDLRLGQRRLRAAVLVVPGHADGAFSIALGYGQMSPDDPTTTIGFDAYRLRQGESFFATGLEVRKVGGHHTLARTQRHFDPAERPIAVHATLAELRARPDLTLHLKGPVQSLLPAIRRDGVQWGMAIDLSVCTGCSACVVACQAENNVAVVGKEGVLGGREMHWLRIDRYHEGPTEDPAIVSQPMLCQHCERAPCEYVCPVNATVHSPDGLNEMVYNRCVGTRFCSSNCPYKVRRFNWFDYVDRSSRSLQRNPDVTVRERGVMEKCTYCVQRIRAAEIGAQLAGQYAGAPEVVTACQEACPTQAIVFGDINDPSSTVSRLRHRAQSYEALHDLGTSPRTRYLAKLSNPNPELHEPWRSSS